MRKKLFLVRHGQTLFNQKHKIQGWCDSPLTPKGVAESKAVGQYFRNRQITFDKACCSTLLRTEESLKHISDLPYTRYEGLKEFGFGRLEGASTDLILSFGHDLLNTSYTQFGGEDPQKVQDRMEKTLNDIVHEDDAKTILIVAHGANLMNLLERIDPDHAKDAIRFINCVIYEVDYDGKNFTIVDSIVSHLAQVKE